MMLIRRLSCPFWGKVASPSPSPTLEKTVDVTAGRFERRAVDLMLVTSAALIYYKPASPEIAKEVVRCRLIRLEI